MFKLTHVRKKILFVSEVKLLQKSGSLKRVPHEKIFIHISAPKLVWLEFYVHCKVKTNKNCKKNPPTLISLAITKSFL